MVKPEMTWERWQSLMQEQKDWEHFAYHERLEERMTTLEDSKFRRGLIQFFGSFAGGASVLMGYLLVFKDICK